MQQEGSTWKNERETWFLLHDNTPARWSLAVEKYLTKHNVMALKHPPYSLDLSPSDFFSFSTLNSVLCEH
jgi:hypothetical protein